MSDIIQLLPDSVANQIAAGEVIQRPASILKELVENSFDAKATHIRIVLKDAGKTLLQVIDNGVGMSETDARMSFDRHATSKIRSAADLFQLRTMGFRGEALASIASVAQVELRTRRADDALGTMIEIAGSRVFAQVPEQCAVGSNFMVKNLFFNVPARRRFLKKNSTELNHLLTEFYRIVLVNPEVAFDLVSDGEELFTLPIGTKKQRIEAVFSKVSKRNFTQQLLTVEAKTNLLTIRGYIGKPEYAQKNAYQYFFVNGRYMRHAYFHKAIMKAYEGMLNDTNPNYFLYFDISPEDIDVNIHPTKTEIKFADEQVVFSILLAAMKETLGKFNVVPSIEFDQEGAIEMPTLPKDHLGSIQPPQTIFNPNYNPFKSSGSYKRAKFDWEELQGEFEAKKAEPVVESEPQEIAFAPVETIGSVVPSHIQVETPPVVVAPQMATTSDFLQFHGRYIVTSVKSGLMMIDQRRAHVRVLYEQYMRQLQSKQGVSQQLLFPEVIDVPLEDMGLMDELLPDLRGVGFDMELFGKQSYSINGIPSDLTNTNVQEVVLNILHEAKTNPAGVKENYYSLIALALARASAINVGKQLGKDEMVQLFESLFAIPEHAYSPDGKPVMTIVSQEEIDKRMR